MAERPPDEPQALERGDTHQGGEGPGDGSGAPGGEAESGVGEDRLGALGQAAHEVQGTFVGPLPSAPLGHGRPGQERGARQVVGDEQGHARQPGLRQRDGHAEDEPGVDREVRHDVGEPAQIRGAVSSSQGAVEPVGQPVGEPQAQRQVPAARTGGDAGADADAETRGGDRARAHAPPIEEARQPIQRPGEGGPRPTIQHLQPTPAPSDRAVLGPAARVVSGLPVGAVPAAAIVVVLFTGALVGAAWTSLHPGAIVGGRFGTGAWREVLTDRAFHQALWFTVWLAAASTALAVPTAVVLAVAVRRSRLARVAVAAPVPVPHLVVAALAVLWLGPGGLADRLVGGLPLQAVGDRWGIGVIVTYVYKEAPFLALIVLAAWDRATDDLLEAAAAFGAGPVRRTLDVLVPRVAPGLALGAAVVAAFVVGATEVPLLVGPSSRDTLATHALDLTRLGGPAARADAAVVLLAAGALAAALVVPVAVLVRRIR